MVYAALYASRPIQPMSEEDLAEILAVSRRKNAERGITGRLVYAATEGEVGLFAQWIEGEDWRVRELLYFSILCDARHAFVGRPFEGPIERRQFPSWTMEFERLGSEEIVSAEIDSLVARAHTIRPQAKRKMRMSPEATRRRHAPTG
ncbi:BLUF domain-containing protein [Rubricoccus marinus]|uniref:BLUF domain-containing protein n=1 Tax=Rubricoccus marinus TaxID=716817 RepID=A0A259U2D2_9BACT|nr:hypothetical protein BSZ36_13815 [Rubricoccus marinus]